MEQIIMDSSWQKFHLMVMWQMLIRKWEKIYLLTMTAFLQVLQLQKVMVMKHHLIYLMEVKNQNYLNFQISLALPGK